MPAVELAVAAFACIGAAISPKMIMNVRVKVMILLLIIVTSFVIDSMGIISQKGRSVAGKWWGVILQKSRVKKTRLKFNHQ